MTHYRHVGQDPGLFTATTRFRSTEFSSSILRVRFSGYDGAGTTAASADVAEIVESLHRIDRILGELVVDFRSGDRSGKRCIGNGRSLGHGCHARDHVIQGRAGFD